MGQSWSSNNMTKMVNNTEARFDKAVKDLDLLQTSGQQTVNNLADIFRQMDKDITTLKSEKESLAKHVQKMAMQSPKDRTMYSHETEIDNDVMKDSLRCRNQELEKRILTLEEQLKQDGTSKGNIIAAMACSALLPSPGDDKYFPTGTKQQLVSNKEQEEDRIKILEERILILSQEISKSNDETSFLGKEVYKIKNENEILQKDKAELEQINKDIRREMGEKINKIEQLQKQVNKLDHQVNQSSKLIDKTSSRFENKNTECERLQGMFQSKENKIKEQFKRIENLEQEKSSLENQIKEFKSSCSDHLQQIQQQDDRIKTLEKDVIQIENKYDVRAKIIDEKKKDIDNLRSEVNQKGYELVRQRRETEQSIKQLKKELSIEAVNTINGKKENEELRKEISGLREDIADLKLKSNQLETDLEMKAANITHERNKLRKEVEEMQEKAATIRMENSTLVEKCQTLEKEIEKLTTKERIKKYISFHCVLRQPQSDQAISGIISLLQQKFEDVDIEIVPETKRSRNVPLLVVMYNLSRLTDDVTGALSGIAASSDVALVVLHSKEIKKASDQVLTLPDFKKLGIIVDMSFISAKGLIHNELTTNAVNLLAGYLNNY